MKKNQKKRTQNQNPDIDHSSYLFAGVRLGRLTTFHSIAVVIEGRTNRGSAFVFNAIILEVFKADFYQFIM
jgi:hypothetical protein